MISHDTILITLGEFRTVSHVLFLHLRRLFSRQLPTVHPPFQCLHVSVSRHRFHLRNAEIVYHYFHSRTTVRALVGQVLKYCTVTNARLVWRFTPHSRPKPLILLFVSKKKIQYSTPPQAACLPNNAVSYAIEYHSQTTPSRNSTSGGKIRQLPDHTRLSHDDIRYLINY